MQSMKILLVEDDDSLAEVVKHGLEQENYAVDWVNNGNDGLDMALAYDYDLIILDIMLPDRDGFEVCQAVRASKIKTPVLMLTARTREDDRIRGLDTGADDYLVKPFSFPELCARLRALIRRSSNECNAVLTSGQLSVDTVSKEVIYANSAVSLTAKEYAVLEYLMYNQNSVVTREMLEEHLWNCDSEAFSNVIEVLISRIRRKLCPDDKESVIKTVKGLGYVIRDA
ncbi:MAG: response regulator transcription factor [Dehalococcoidales bacterium]|jgi:two-component system copper resistance phosphate regulon response regulator CusR|nr:response regulator transcription factor [Limnochordia bacterium]MDD2252265.1 response regulator transcription factor [Dehalococcoidales bacterium]MDD4322894.1 response regulator transcription factor [Dehalococcoidales bacterium]MDD5122171.1 response regulator transcription factor [Dehalococcoidales bacterium]MDD5498981.1 response regulator transcription factor [Dehalococcoidales bacterium]